MKEWVLNVILCGLLAVAASMIIEEAWKRIKYLIKNSNKNIYP